MKDRPLKERIREAYKATQQYHEMMSLVWPREKYPNAHAYRLGGGPPVCAMPFGRAIREMGGTDRHLGSGRTIWLPEN